MLKHRLEIRYRLLLPKLHSRMHYTSNDYANTPIKKNLPVLLSVLKAVATNR